MNSVNRTTYDDIVTCELAMTASARKGIEKVARDERAFFAIEKTFAVHIEKRPDNQHGSQSFSFFFDNEANSRLAAVLGGRVAVLDCVVKNDGFLAVGFHVRGRREPAATNRRLRASVKFRPGKSTGRALPIEFAALLRELPVAEERSEYVKKRIGGWEGYLRIMEKNADVEDIHAKVRSVSNSADFRRISIQAGGLPGKAWKQLPGFSAKFDGMPYELGTVVSADRKQERIDIDLKPAAVQHARKTGFHGPQFGAVTFSNFAELSQVRRLRRGFKDLQDGLAANANLEKILFEERPVVKITNRRQPLEFSSRLNEFQEEAVTGAMNASDLYVIQGPPGTGKTTVISELCSQAVKAGMRTLVASQANLAVDNALGRLLDHPDIRILRYGRTESIEEEGRKFIAENVAEHWREQTLEMTGAALQQHGQLADVLAAELTQSEEQLAELEKESEQLQLRQAVWLERKREAETLGAALKEEERELQRLSLELEKNTGSRTSLQQQRTKLDEELERLTDQLGRLENPAVSMETMEDERRQLASRIGLLKNARSAAELEEQADLLGREQHQLAETCMKNRSVLDGIEAAPKLNDLNDLLEAVSYTPSEKAEQMMITLIRQIDSIQEAGGEAGVSAWSEALGRTDRAIAMVTDILHTHHFHNRIVIPTGYRNRHSLADIQETVNRVGRYLIQPSVKKILSTTAFSVEAYDCLENLTKSVTVLHDRKNFITALLAEARSSADLFRAIKQEVHDGLAAETGRLETDLTRIRERTEALQAQLAEIRKAGMASGEGSFTTVLADAERDYEELGHKIDAAAKTEAERQALESERERAVRKSEDHTRQLEEGQQQETRLLQQLAAARQAIEEKRGRTRELAEALHDDPAVRIAANVQEQQQAKADIRELEKKRANIPRIQSLQSEWHTMLQAASPYDLDEIRKLYVKHANVIGTTCVASARKEFAEEYPQFDLVIIDEVSKATPPELLLPMLKGRKIVLVGDHHQLPPLVGQETMEEFLEEMPDDTEKREMEKLLKESLFERLFRTLPKQNKTMLGKQYRMHEDIMQTITPFYDENGYALTCGLPDSDAARAHGLETRLVKPHNHLLWIDMPNTPPYFEAKPKGGTSRYNDSELTAIRQLLEELDEGTAAAIAEGTLPADMKKKIGVISFYGEQVKRIDRLLQEDIQPQHLEFRTGSVDKFQGMEMDIIIVSFVRNHGEPSGDIGFAKDYRRLNVALSRAKELLVIVGSSAMFTEKPKPASVRSMYRRLYETVERQQGLRTPAEPVRS